MVKLNQEGLIYKVHHLIKLLMRPSSTSFAMMSNVFQAHGRFCASHPLEVLVTIVTLIISLMSLQPVEDEKKVCGWNYKCAKEQPVVRGSDVIVLSLARCIALVYMYMQFRSLRRLGSKYLLGISGLFTIMSSFIFCIAVVKLFGNDLSGLHEALPFFLVLIDLSKASALAAFALNSKSRSEIQNNIAQGMGLLGPAITLDACVETLAIGIGTLSGVKQVETMCCFGCLSVVANYIAFMTFYPACLSLVLELSQDTSQEKDQTMYKQLAERLQMEHMEKKSNPVTQRVKMIMSIGLAVVHLHRRFVSPSLSDDGGDVNPLRELELTDRYTEPEMSIWQFYLYRAFAVHVDYGLTLILAIALLLKYMYIDEQHDIEMQKHVLQLQSSSVAMTPPPTPSPTSSCVTTQCSFDQTDAPFPRGTSKVSFTVGDLDDSSDKEMESKETQTDAVDKISPLKRLESVKAARPLEECLAILKSENGVLELSDEEIVHLVRAKHIPAYNLEKVLQDYERGVACRRRMISDQIHSSEALEFLPYSNFDYKFVDGACCENVIGYTPVPVGVAGPLLLNGKQLHVPLATTEGCLVASTNRGCRAIQMSGGVHSDVIGDGMSRGPVVRFPSARMASKTKFWLEDADNFDLVKESFDLTSRFARLDTISVAQAGRLLYIRFVAQTGDAMGMNMLSKGTEKGLHLIQEHFPDMEILSLSGNYCTDKKPAALNWLEGRGKSVVCEAIIPRDVVEKTLKTSVKALVELNISKNLVGSAMAGSIGGFNAHAANIVTAIFIATGQDPAQTVSSANCITLMEATGEEGRDLYITCTMPSIEVGTVGGGTILPPQAACLQMLGVQGSSVTCPGENARQLAQVVCATVLAGELSLMSALAAGHLVRSHLTHNRSSVMLDSSMNSFSSQDSQLLSNHSGRSNEASSSISNIPHIATSPSCFSPASVKREACVGGDRDVCRLDSGYSVTRRGTAISRSRSPAKAKTVYMSSKKDDMTSCIKHVS